MCGQSCDMMQIKKLSKIYGFKIIEDASQIKDGKYDKFQRWLLFVLVILQYLVFIQSK